MIRFSNSLSRALLYLSCLLISFSCTQDDSEIPINTGGTSGGNTGEISGGMPGGTPGGMSGGVEGGGGISTPDCMTPDEVCEEGEQIADESCDEFNEFDATTITFKIPVFSMMMK